MNAKWWKVSERISFRFFGGIFDFTASSRLLQILVELKQTIIII